MCFFFLLLLGISVVMFEPHKLYLTFIYLFYNFALGCHKSRACEVDCDRESTIASKHVFPKWSSPDLPNINPIVPSSLLVGNASCLLLLIHNLKSNSIKLLMLAKLEVK